MIARYATGADLRRLGLPSHLDEAVARHVEQTSERIAEHIMREASRWAAPMADIDLRGKVVQK